MRNISFVYIDLCWYMFNWQHKLIHNILICGLKAKTQLLVCNKMLAPEHEGMNKF